MGNLPQNITQLEYTKFIADSNNKVAVRTVMGDGNATIYAVVNTSLTGTTNSLATLLAGPNQIGSVTVSNPISIAIGTNYIGLVTVTEAIPYSSPSVSTGMVSAASGALVQFATNSIKWLDVRSSYANSTIVYIGGSNATINNGFPLAPGDTIGMAISNTNQLYLVGVGTSEVRFLGGN